MRATRAAPTASSTSGLTPTTDLCGGGGEPRAPDDVEDVDRLRHGSPAPVPPRPTTRSVTLSLTIPFGARVRTTRRITVSPRALTYDVSRTSFVPPPAPRIVACASNNVLNRSFKSYALIPRPYVNPPNPGPPGNPPPNPPPGNPPAPGRPPRIACSLNARSISRIKLELSFPNISLNTLSASSRVKSFLYSYVYAPPARLAKSSAAPPPPYPYPPLAAPPVDARDDALDARCRPPGALSS